MNIARPESNVDPVHAEPAHSPVESSRRSSGRTSSSGERLWFAGCAFELLLDDGLPALELKADHELFASSEPEAATAGHVLCAVSPDPSLDEPAAARDIRWQWDGESAEVRTRRVRARLSQLGAGRFAASAHVSPDSMGMASLLTALSGAVVCRAGGLVVHAAAVEIDGRAVLFIGPSGAGKTTACGLARGTRWFARDRAAIFPTSQGWMASPMPGGDDIDLPWSGKRCLPLGAVLRVRRGQTASAIRPLGVAESLLVLRESVQAAGDSPIDESARFDAMAALHGAVPVGALYSVLESPITEELQAWLRTQ